VLKDFVKPFLHLFLFQQKRTAFFVSDKISLERESMCNLCNLWSMVEMCVVLFVECFHYFEFLAMRSCDVFQPACVTTGRTVHVNGAMGTARVRGDPVCLASNSPCGNNYRATTSAGRILRRASTGPCPAEAALTTVRHSLDAPQPSNQGASTKPTGAAHFLGSSRAAIPRSVKWPTALSSAVEKLVVVALSIHFSVFAPSLRFIGNAKKDFHFQSESRKTSDFNVPCDQNTKRFIEKRNAFGEQPFLFSLVESSPEYIYQIFDEIPNKDGLHGNLENVCRY
jgi:hypothetical protein